MFEKDIKTCASGDDTHAEEADIGGSAGNNDELSEGYTSISAEHKAKKRPVDYIYSNKPS